MSAEFTPRARSGLVAAGINPDTLRRRVPKDWRLYGYGHHSPRSWSFEIRRVTGELVASTTVYQLEDIPAAIEKLLAVTA